MHVLIWFQTAGHIDSVPDKSFWKKIILKKRKLKKEKLHSMQIFKTDAWERSGSVVECLTRDRKAAGLASSASLSFGPQARHIYPSLELVQPREARPCLTERLLMGRKESNQTNKQTKRQMLAKTDSSVFHFL